MDNQDYFDKDFDPNKVTIRRLKEILNAHNISYKNVSRKADFVQKFQEYVLPIVESQRRTEEKEETERKEDTELQQERKTVKDHRLRKTSRHNEEETEPEPPDTTTQTKTPYQRKKRSGRASIKKQKEETVPQQDDGQSSRSIVVDEDDNSNNAQPSLTSQSSGNEQQTTTTQQSTSRQNYPERLSPPRPLKAPTSPTPFYPIVPPYPRNPVYPFLEPEELEVVRRKDKELQQSSERQEVPIYPPIQEVSQHPPQKGPEIRTVPEEDKAKDFERHEAFAYCFKPQAPKRNINRKPPPEFIKRKQRIRLSSGIYVLFIIFMFGFLYVSLKTKIGFCDSVEPPIPEGENVQPLAQLVVNMMCTSCPPKATCSMGVITGCEEGFKPETSFLRFTKPYYTHCAIDKDRKNKTKRYIREFKEIIARETGRYECGYEDKDSLINENLKLQLIEIMPPQDYEYINGTYESVLEDEDVVVQDDYIYSKKPTYGFYCQLSSFFISFLQNVVLGNPLYSLAFVSILLGTWYVRRWIWERRQVKVAFDLALMRLSEHKQIIGLQFREEAFAHVKDPTTRQKLFQKLDEKVRAYPYVRAGNTRYDGFEAGLWEWKAPSTSHVNPK